jgi:hypothetical protein
VRRRGGVREFSDKEIKTLLTRPASLEMPHYGQVLSRHRCPSALDRLLIRAALDEQGEKSGQKKAQECDPRFACPRLVLHSNPLRRHSIYSLNLR